MKAKYYCDLTHLSEEEIKRMLMRNGPATTSLNTGKIHYLKGKFNGKCDSDKCTHSVLLVGWDEKYWIIKNSWTTNWGVNGYLYLPIKNANCGFQKYLEQVIVSKK